MKIVLLDPEQILSIDDLHRSFAGTLGFPDYYGKNLDALHDCLTDIHGEVGVIAVNTEALRRNVGPRRWKAFTRLMADLQEEKKLRYTEDPFGNE